MASHAAALTRTPTIPRTTQISSRPMNKSHMSVPILTATDWVA